MPYRIHTVLTDTGIQFRLPPRDADGPTARYLTHMFDLRCAEHGIEHRFTRINHPWTNGQVERMNRTIKDATVKRFHDDNHDQLRRHLDDFVAAYNFGRRLGSKPNHPPGAWPVPRCIRGVRPLADAASIGRAAFLAACLAGLGHPPRV